MSLWSLKRAVTKGAGPPHICLVFKSHIGWGPAIQTPLGCVSTLLVVSDSRLRWEGTIAWKSNCWYKNHFRVIAILALRGKFWLKTIVLIVFNLDSIFTWRKGRGGRSLAASKPRCNSWGATRGRQSGSEINFRSKYSGIFNLIFNQIFRVRN